MASDEMTPDRMTVGKMFVDEMIKNKRECCKLTEPELCSFVWYSVGPTRHTSTSVTAKHLNLFLTQED
jgi:hypothetical protein